MSAKPFRIQGAQTLASAPVAQVNRSTAVVDQLQGGAADIRREGEKLEAHRLKRTEEKERFGSLVGLQKLNADLAAEDQTRLDAMEPGAENYASDSMKFYETAEEKYLATVPQSQQEAIQLRLDSLREKYSAGTAATERDERNRFQTETIGSALEGYAVNIRSNPGAYEASKNSASELIDASSLPLGVKAKLTAASGRALSLAWAGGLSPQQKIAWFKPGGSVPEQFAGHVEALQAKDYEKIERVGETETKQQEAVAKDSAWQSVANGADPDDFAPEIKALLGSAHSSMRQMYKNLQKTDSPYAANTDKVSMAKALALPNEQIAGLDLNQYKATSTEADFARLVMRQEKAKHAIQADAADPKMAGIAERSLKQMSLTADNWGSSKNSNEKRAQENLARDELTGWIQGFIEQNKRKPTEDEVRTQAARQMVQIEADPTWLFNSASAKAFNADSLTDDQKEVARVSYDTINNRILSEIESQLKVLGIEPTEDLVEQLAGAAAVGDRPRALTLLGIKER